MADNTKRPERVLAQQLKAIRQGRGISARALAEKIATNGGTLDRVAIASIEANKRGVSLDEALELAAALDMAPLHLFIPLDDDGDVQVTHEQVAPAVDARRWVRGEEPLPGMDEKTFRTEVPASEWEAAQAPSPDEQKALNALERAEHRLQVAERKLALVAESPTIPMSLQAKVAGGIFGQDPSELLERRLDRAWKDVAEAEVYLDKAQRQLSAVQSTRDEGRS